MWLIFLGSSSSTNENALQRKKIIQNVNKIWFSCKLKFEDSCNSFQLTNECL